MVERTRFTMHSAFATHDASPDGDEVRLERLRGETFLVAPVTMLREGVLNGGFVPSDEIEHSLVGWDGRPVTAPPEPGESGHPMEGGEFTSANQLPFLETHHIGHVLNTGPTEDGDGAQAEAWVNVQRAREVGDTATEVVRRLAHGEELEVSTGYWHGVRNEQGTHEGEPYEQVQFDLMPDHLAMLPNEDGACSWADGCGAPRVNTELAANEQATELLADGGAGDTQSATTLFDKFLRFIGAQSAEDVDIDLDSHTANCDDCNHTMTIDIDALASQTAFDAETLTEWDEDDLEALKESVAANDDGGDDGGDGTDEPTGDGSGTDAGSTDDTTTEDVSDLKARIEELEQKVAANEQDERESYVDTITANTDLTDEDLSDTEEWPTHALATLAEQVSTDDDAPGEYAGQAGNRVNYLGQGGGASAPGDDDEEDDFSSVGALAALSKQEGD